MSERAEPSESELGNRENEAARLSRLVRMDIAEQLKGMAETLKSGDAGSAPGAHGDGTQHANQSGDDANRQSQQNDSTHSQQSDQPQPNGSAQGDTGQQQLNGSAQGDAGQQAGDSGQTLLGELAHLASAQAEKAIEQIVQETLKQVDQVRLDLFRPDLD